MHKHKDCLEIFSKSDPGSMVYDENRYEIARRRTWRCWSSWKHEPVTRHCSYRTRNHVISVNSSVEPSRSRLPTKKRFAITIHNSERWQLQWLQCPCQIENI